jgi:hypothetical protein
MIEQVMQDAPMWIAWILAFFAIEFDALFNKKRGDTWSEVIRYWFGFSKRAGDLQSNGMRLRRLSFYAVSGVFILHIKGAI